MHLVDARKLHKGMQQQVGRHVGVVQLGVQWVLRREW
jgi:hypothetical protein